ncbi:MAG: acyltransferase [Caulobacteraceae bacterium]|nr:MAG: acyltransferase [Caulobacteraceae bacterium]
MGFEGTSAVSKKLDWLDYTRFVAAVAVMLFHYLANGPRNGKTGETADFGWAGAVAEYGYLGVDVFFIVSGFVILFSAIGRRADEFAVSRAVRLWATFAVCMTLTALAKNLWGLPGDHVGLLRYLANLSMVPEWLGQRPVDGIYWSLAVELVFYGAVFIILALGQMHRVRGILAAWVALLLLVRIAQGLWSLPPPPLFGHYFDLFAAGCTLALIRRTGWDPLLATLLIVSSGLAAHGAFLRAAIHAGEGRPIVPLVAAAIVLVTLLPFLLFMKRGPSLPAARDAGRITYPLYLLHAHIGYIVLRQLHWPPQLEAPLVAGLAILAAWLVYRLFEEPTEAFRRKAADLLIGWPVRKLLRIKPARPEG